MPRHLRPTPRTQVGAPKGAQAHGPPPQGWGCRSSHLAGGMPGSEQAAGAIVPHWGVALREWVQTWGSVHGGEKNEPQVGSSFIPRESQSCPQKVPGKCLYLPRLFSTRSLPYWWSRAQSLLYCSETTVPGTFLEESHSCTCPSDQPSCQGSIPCALGEGSACASCAEDNSTRCGTCNHGYMLTQGFCRPEVADSLEHYLGLETDLQDLELKYLLQKRDSRIEVHSIFISNDMRLGSWFDPSWRKRMLLTLKSNKYKPGLVHVMLALSLQICLTKNSTLEPVMAIYVNPFGGSHSESWFMPVNEGSFPDWERTNVDASAQCQNWTLTLGNKWKTFFETVHVYLRSRIKSLDDSSNETVYYEPLEMADPSKNLGYMKINSLQVFGYSLPFEPDAIRDLILQLDYPYTQGSQDSAMLQLLEIRDRVNRLSPPGKPRLDLFTCLLRHRLKLANNEVARIQSSLRAFNTKLPNAVEHETSKLCS